MAVTLFTSSCLGGHRRHYHHHQQQHHHHHQVHLLLPAGPCDAACFPLFSTFYGRPVLALENGFLPVPGILTLFYTKQLLHKPAFTQTRFYTNSLFHTNELLHAPASTQTNFSTNQLLHNPSVGQRPRVTIVAACHPIKFYVEPSGTQWNPQVLWLTPDFHWFSLSRITIEMRVSQGIPHIETKPFWICLEISTKMIFFIRETMINHRI